ncbi:MAG: hypothetical protein FJ308_04390 [Planctomycetes bacterium]|nr:hypothetical protein [Planctomycetota bacterium]
MRFFLGGLLVFTTLIQVPPLATRCSGQTPPATFVSSTQKPSPDRRAEVGMASFPLSQVRISEGVFRESIEVNLKVLREIGVERALYAFRFQAGLPTGDVKPLRGWASPEPYGAFPGFFEGHYLTALAMHASQDADDDLKREVFYMVKELGRCQKAMGGKYLFASPEIEFEPDRLDGVAWYRMHKLLEGLLAAYQHIGCDEALDVAVRVADWIDQRMESYGDRWAKVKSIEFGGMAESLEGLFPFTGNPHFHELAIRWEEPERILQPFAAGKDFNEHANTLLAKMVGAARVAEVSHSPLHRHAVAGFWNQVVGTGRKTYATGGTSVHEGMPSAGRLANTQSRMPQETCVSYNLLKVTQAMFRLTRESSYIDYYERVLWNSILGSQDPTTGWKSYYQPLNANAVKDFRSHENGCYCCNGTGLENPARFASMIYSHDNEELCVNLFIPSRVHWPEQKITLEQTTNFPVEDRGVLTIDSDTSVEFTLSLRIPSWCGESPRIWINGELTQAQPTKGSYARMRRIWKMGDKVEFQFPLRFSFYPMPDDRKQVALMYGPIVLVGAGARETLSELVGDPENPSSKLNHLDAWLSRDSKESLDFVGVDDASREILFRPYYQIGADQFFTGYWDLVSRPKPRSGPSNLALGKRTQCSTPTPEGSNLECFMRAAKAVDGQFGEGDDWYVKWFPNGMSPQWIIVDLGQAHDIQAIEWVPAKEDSDAKIAYRYRMEVSSDGNNWQEVADASSNKLADDSYRHEVTISGRYVRLTTLPNPKLKDHQARPKIAELMVFGK